MALSLKRAPNFSLAKEDVLRAAVSVCEQVRKHWVTLDRGREMEGNTNLCKSESESSDNAA